MIFLRTQLNPQHSLMKKPKKRYNPLRRETQNTNTHTGHHQICREVHHWSLPKKQPSAAFHQTKLICISMNKKRLHCNQFSAITEL